MPFSLRDLIYGGLLPGLAAALLWYLFRRWTRGEFLRRLGHSLPFVGGFHVGYWLLSLGDASPESHWEWLPWVLLMTWAGSLPTDVRATLRLLRYSLIIFAVVASAWVIVPDWEHLDPPQMHHQVTLTLSVLLLAALLEPLSQRFSGWKLLALLAVVLTSTAVILALSGSLRFAQIAGCGVAALAGMAVTAFLDRDQPVAAGIALPYSLFVAAIMLIGKVNSFSDVPLISFVLPPLAPLALWAAVAGPSAEVKGIGRWVVSGLPLVVCLLAIVLAAMA